MTVSIWAVWSGWSGGLERGCITDTAAARRQWQRGVGLRIARRVAYECGHLCVCEACAETVAECPLCRGPVARRRRIYFD